MKKNIKYLNMTVVDGSPGQQPKRTLQFFCFLLLLFISITSCKKMVEVSAPVTSINEANVYNSDATAISVLTGLYAKMSKDRFGFAGDGGISELAGLSADEFSLYSSSATLQPYYKNALLSNSSKTIGAEFWSFVYGYIFTCNAAIDGLSKSSQLSTNVKQQLLGEAKFMRAFYYFYLVNLYGDVPLVLSTDPVINASLSKTPKNLIYQQIVIDLKDAQNLLSSDFLNGLLQKYTSAEERVRPSKWAATAMLARVYLYLSEWSNAETQASILISNSSLFSLSNLNAAFLKASMGNKEAIWQLQPVTTGHNTEDGWYFVLPSTGPTTNTSHPVYLSPQLVNSFEVNDQRRYNRNWIDSVKVGTVNPITYYFPIKYKIATLNSPVNEYLMALRLGEQYLIRAEARAQLNNFSGSQADLNAIRTRAGLPNTTASNQGSLLTAILHERQVELFTEFGHRWLDLKRTGNIDAVMNIVTPQKGGTWQPYKQLYPILFNDIQKNPNLTQNVGY